MRDYLATLVRYSFSGCFYERTEVGWMSIKLGSVCNIRGLQRWSIP
jgi:hypothetical protein